MKKAKKIVSLITGFVLILTSVVCCNIQSNANDISYSNGQIIEFGAYPQSKVTDTALLFQLNSIATEWTKYDYWCYRKNESGERITDKVKMFYSDICYNGEKYRGVKLMEYRPSRNQGYTSKSSSTQYDNKYYCDDAQSTYYWFKYESLSWIIIDAKTGLVLCENVIDAQTYQDIYYAEYDGYIDANKTKYLNNYADSTIRKWLSETFYNTAFTVNEENVIKTSKLTHTGYKSIYSIEPTYDKIYLLSYEDVTNTSYGFSNSMDENDANRVATSATDYALCQGVYVSSYANNRPMWRLRTPSNYENYNFIVNTDGALRTNYSTDCSDIGIRPAMKLNLTLLGSDYDNDTTESSSNSITQPSTKPSTEPSTQPSTEPSTEPNTELSTEPSTEPTTKPTTAPSTKLTTKPANTSCSHSSTKTSVVKKATLKENGKKQKVCSKCGKVISASTINFAKTFTISKSSYTYTGKALTKPTVTVKDSAGNKLSASYYTVSYISRSNNKGISKLSSIGQYKVKVTLKGEYSGIKYLYFSVKPKTSKLKSLSTKNKSVTAKWTKDKKVSGYQIVIATDSKFTKNKKTVNINKNSTTSYKFSNLKKGKKYYVKVRAYKIIKVDGKKAKIYGPYCACKSVKYK